MTDDKDVTQDRGATGPISVTYTIDVVCFMRACHALWAYRAIGRFGNYIVSGVVCLCAAFLIWQKVPGPLPYLLLGGVGLFAAMTLLRDALWRRYYHRLEKYRGPIHTTISYDGLEVIAAGRTDHMPWSRFRSFLRTDEFLFLIIDQRQFSIIPLIAFETPVQATRFEGIMADHLPRLPRRYL